MEGFFLGDNVSVRHDSPVCSVVFVVKQLCTQVRLLRTFLHVFRGHRKRLFYVVSGCNGGVKGCFLGDNVSFRHDSPVCSVVFITKQLCTQV